MPRSSHVRCERPSGISACLAHLRLGPQVEHNLGPRRADRSGDGTLILEPTGMPLNAAHIRTIQQGATFVLRHDERMDLGPHRNKAERQMRTDETGCARDEDSSAVKRLFQAP
jgi:hypothetical protein